MILFLHLKLLHVLLTYNDVQAPNHDDDDVQVLSADDEVQVSSADDGDVNGHNGSSLQTLHCGNSF